MGTSRLGRGLLVASLLGAAVLIGGAAPSSAHTDLLSSTPEDGATVTDAPETVSLTFNEAVSADFTRMQLTVSGGQTILEVVQGLDERTVVAAVPPDTSAGSWNVGYRVTSVDGHVVTGEIRFEVKPSSTKAQSSPASPTVPTDATAHAEPSEPVVRETSDHAGTVDPDGGQRTNLALTALIGAGAAAVVVAVSLLLRRRRRADGTPE